MNQQLAQQTNFQQNKLESKKKEKGKMRTQQGFFSKDDRLAQELTAGTDFVSGIDKKTIPFKKAFLSDEEGGGGNTRKKRPASANF